MAQRQYMRKIRTGSVRFEDVYRAVSEYRTQYPDKAVIYSAPKHPEMCWASLMAGGSCAAIPVKDHEFLAEVSKMKPSPSKDGTFMLKGENGMLIYSNERNSDRLDIGKNKYILYTINGETGEISRIKEISDAFSPPERGIFWLKKK